MCLYIPPDVFIKQLVMSLSGFIAALLIAGVVIYHMYVAFFGYPFKQESEEGQPHAETH